METVSYIKSVTAIGTQIIGPEMSPKKIRHEVALAKSKVGVKSSPIYVVKQTAGIRFGNK
jgi:hypothetical protein